MDCPSQIKGLPRDLSPRFRLSANLLPALGVIVRNEDLSFRYPAALSTGELPPFPGWNWRSAVVTNALLAAIGDVGPHGGQPFQGRVGFLLLAVLGKVRSLHPFANKEVISSAEAIFTRERRGQEDA